MPVTRGRVLALGVLGPWLLCVFATRGALANGRFPTAGHVAFDPLDEARFAVRTTFGLLTSKDAGASVDFVCESALRLGVEEDPMLAFTESGPLVVATFGGVLTSNDGCSYRFVPELEGQVVLDLARSAVAPDTLVAFRLLGRGGGLYDSGVVRSDDAGTSWTFLPLFPEEYLPVTVDIAARDPERVYVTARRGVDQGYDSALLVSDDGGETFVARVVPDTEDQHLAYIAAVHPEDADRLTLRVDDLEGTILYETRDAGASFQKLFVGSGRLTGFAYAPDGVEIAFGGLDDGLWVGSSDVLVFEQRSGVGPLCLAWNARGLWACADAQRTGFSFGRSSDAGRSFEPLFSFSELCGRSSCADTSDVGGLCPTDWQSVGPALGATCDLGDAGASGDGGSPNERAPARPTGRGGCTASGRAGDRSFVAWFLAGALVATAARWRRVRAFGRGSFRFRRGSPSSSRNGGAGGCRR
jgi:hypothetical protein